MNGGDQETVWYVSETTNSLLLLEHKMQVARELCRGQTKGQKLALKVVGTCKDFKQGRDTIRFVF